MNFFRRLIMVSFILIPTISVLGIIQSRTLIFEKSNAFFSISTSGSIPVVDVLAIALCSSKYSSKSILLNATFSSINDLEKMSLIKKFDIVLIKMEKGYKTLIIIVAGRANNFNSLFGNNEKN